MTYDAEIAIVESNTLTSIGLKSLIEKMLPTAVVRTFMCFEDLIRDTPDTYVHYFVSAQTLLEHTVFFLERKHKCIVLVSEGVIRAQLSEFHTLNVNLPEESLTRALLKLHKSAHHHEGPKLSLPTTKQEDTMWKEPNGLSFRELEVLVLIVKGLINKEIAERLNISLTTVITHRKNITEKLNIRSVSGLTIYAVMNGYVEADRI